MARELNRLTATQVKNAQPGEKPNSPRLLADGGGLYLQITPQGSKSYLFRYTFDGKPRTLGLGPVHTISLAAARGIAQECRATVLGGDDPKIQRERNRARKNAELEQTFEWCAGQYIEAHKGEWKNAKHLHQWHQSLEDYAFPTMGKLSVREIDVHHVMAVLEPIWSSKTETATRLRGRIERILGWAAIKGFRGNDNPARWRAYLSELLRKPRKVTEVKHHPAIAHRDMADFVVRLKALPDSVAVSALEFLILTATRTGEVIGARWSEFDFSAKVWTIPPDRMKAGRAHVVPLSDRAAEIVKNIKRMPDERFVFRGVQQGKHISNMAMLQVMRRMMLIAVPHGMRSSFRDWAADMTEYPRELAEAALAHVIGDKTEAAYLRSDRLARRRAMMDDWASYCGQIPSAKVVAGLKPPSSNRQPRMAKPRAKK